MSELLLGKEDGIATMTLNRPEKLNALTQEMFVGIERILREVDADDEIKVLILTGTGAGFCSGADVSARLAVEAAGKRVETTRKELLEPFGAFVLPIRRSRKPIIAAVNGVAAGGGFSLAMACDLRIASEKARFSAVWVRRGLIPDTGLTYFLPQTVGFAKALELMWLGDTIDAREAERLGLVTRVVAHEGLMKETRELAGRLAKGPSAAIELIKRAVYRRFQGELETQLDFETYADNLCHGTEDFKEGVASFLERRPPMFKGR